jgi:hypothetical protein|tara:strand:- start:716 stop:1300 length:585 start_codon:yes stop_codon:yes gene_type:complete
VRINSYLLFAILSILVLPAFANPSQTQATLQSKHFKSIACDDSGVHCLALSHMPEIKYSLRLYRTDNAGADWYKLNTNFYSRIGSDKALDGFAGMEIACDQYLQTCLVGVTILLGHASVFFGTHDGGQTWKGTIVWNEPEKTLQSSYIEQLTCNASTGSTCHVLKDTHDIYILEHDEQDGIFGPDSLNLTMRPM